MGCIIKILVLLIIILAILVILQCGGGSCIKKIDQTLPDKKTVPWEVTTPTHVYYAIDILDTAPAVAMSGWYEQIEGKWVKNEDTLQLDRKIYGKITVRRR